MLIEKRKTLVLAVSGGPDSMFLLYWAIKKFKKAKIIVCSMNYNLRIDSEKDNLLVKQFCENNSVVFEYKSVDSLNDLRYKNTNFENQARLDRYLFFKDIYQKYNANLLLLAHHKDDFLETAMLQKNASKSLFHYGIRQKNKLLDMNIYRPFLFKYYKNQILSKCSKYGIDFMLDYTNHSDDYARNKIRNNLLSLTFKEKEVLLNSFKKINKNNSVKEKRVDKELASWKKAVYSQEFFDQLTYKKEVLYKLIHNNFLNINITDGKLNSLIDFVQSQNRTSKYKLKDGLYLFKEKGKLLI
ncbi:tRNA lysidine(34) synthetase TilS [Mycoplasmopsis iners]|uniref:tRNA lysidine(34) synthetase TilS n=1 Tax=Mycoplasmopsis iners TaxID=76630 RepID=UPI00049681C0|nr:tRNA lysidine(34) synthetase TilS [Mycoplasmopsis iners]